MIMRLSETGLFRAGGRVDGRMDISDEANTCFTYFCEVPKNREDWIVLQGVAFVYFEKSVKCCGKQTDDINTLI